MSILRFNFCLALVLAVLCGSGCGSEGGWKRETFAFAMPVEKAAAPEGTNTVALGHVEISPLFQTRSFTYCTGSDAYKQDPYAGFLVAPEKALAEPMRAWLRIGGELGRVAEPGSALAPNIVVEATVNELCGKFTGATPEGDMEIHFLIYRSGEEGPGRILLDQTCACHTPLRKRAPAALMAAWDEDLRQIMRELNTDYAKAHSNDR